MGAAVLVLRQPRRGCSCGLPRRSRASVQKMATVDLSTDSCPAPLNSPLWLGPAFVDYYTRSSLARTGR